MRSDHRAERTRLADSNRVPPDSTLGRPQCPLSLEELVIRVLRVLVAVATALAVGVPVGTAAADPLDLVCAGTQTVTYSPGLTLVPTSQTITVQAIYSPCVSASQPAVTAGQAGVTTHEVRSCLDVAEPGGATRFITWNTGQTSTFLYNAIVNTVGGNTVVTLTGTITAGLFAGDSAVQVIVGPTLDTLSCLIPPGITSRFSVTTLTITGT